MNKLKVFCFTIAATASSIGYAGIPGDGDCESWLNVLNICEANGRGSMYGMTCAEIHSIWRSCPTNGNGSC